jgi:hypothetical protein
MLSSVILANNIKTFSLRSLWSVRTFWENPSLSLDDIKHLPLEDLEREFFDSSELKQFRPIVYLIEKCSNVEKTILMIKHMVNKGVKIKVCGDCVGASLRNGNAPLIKYLYENKNYKLQSTFNFLTEEPFLANKKIFENTIKNRISVSK